MFPMVLLAVLSADPDNGLSARQGEVLSENKEVRLINRLDGTKFLCETQKVISGPVPSRIGKWVVGAAVLPPPPPPAPTTDPYGFGNLLNNLRARMGLRLLAYDHNLSAWAGQNNAVQNRRGLGHHINPGYRQNVGWNYSSASAVFTGWQNSGGHYQTMVANASTYGIAYGPGPYWTLNVR